MQRILFPRKDAVTSNIFEIKTAKTIFKQYRKAVFTMDKIGKYLFLWGLGGAIYYSIEILYRGFSHWTMFVLGGICFLFCGFQGNATGWSAPLWRQVICCMIFISSGEFITGILVNKIFRLEVWDYSDVPLNLFGQICLPYALAFGCLATIGI